MAMRPCIEDGCPNLTSTTRCAAHESEHNRKRGSATARGLGYQYQQARLRVLRRDVYTCHWCGGPATTANHVKPRIRGGDSSDDNLVASCGTCNFGRPTG